MSGIKTGSRVTVTSKHNPDLKFEGEVGYISPGGQWLDVTPDGHVSYITADLDDWRIEPVRPKITFGVGAVVEFTSGLKSPAVRFDNGKWTYSDGALSIYGDEGWTKLIQKGEARVLSYGVGGGV